MLYLQFNDSSINIFNLLRLILFGFSEYHTIYGTLQEVLMSVLHFPNGGSYKNNTIKSTFWHMWAHMLAHHQINT